MRVFVVSKELSPFTSNKELGDNIKNLALALRDEGCRVSLVIPGYPSLLEQREPSLFCDQSLNIEGNSFRVIILRTEFFGIPLYFIYSPAIFSEDQAESALFFCKSVSLLVKMLDRPPDVLLANDWETGLLMPLLKEEVKSVSKIFIIHNMSHGLVPLEKKHILGLPESYYSEEEMGFYGQISLLKAGILYSDAIITSSPTYAKEIQRPEFGAGVDNILRDINHKLYGILNGCDYTRWNPETDLFIKECYSEHNLTGKLVCKEDLIKELKIADSLKDIQQTPILAMPMKLEEHKGCSLVIQAARRLAEMKLIIVALGKGDPILENLFWELSIIYPDTFYLLKKNDHVTLHKLIAGADMVLIPSLFEPCGVMQMYAMRYGTIPVVRATGGLNDTVIDPEESFPGTGFKFYKADPYDMVKAIERALSVYGNKEIWYKMVRNAMKQRFLWSSCAKQYVKIFKKLQAFV